MERVDIRLSKIKPLRIIIPLAIAIPVVTYAVYFTDKFAHNQYIKYWIPILDIWGLFVFYKILKGLIENRPVITFTKDFLETNDKGEGKKYKWADIVDVTIGKDDRNVSDLLKIKTTKQVDQIFITQLDKSADEIKELIGKYR